MQAHYCLPSPQSWSYDKNKDYRVEVSMYNSSTTTGTYTIIITDINNQNVILNFSRDFALKNYIQSGGELGFMATTNGMLIDNLLYEYDALDSMPISYTLIPITDPNIYWSEYNRYASGDYKQTNAGGAYMKLAFSGTTL